MGKTLRVCLAMGGGVSLGSFSGSALTEALKLLILYGRDNDKKEYQEIIVDGMSGASAGAIALTIMLKCLIDYRSMIPLFSEKLKEGDLLDEIINDYFGGDAVKAEKHRKKFETLKALQLAQKIQYKLWVDEVNSVKLYGDKIDEKYKAKPNESFSLLDRKLLEELTKKYLMTSEGVDISRRQLLDPKRVIFACSLTNLLPIEIDFFKKSNLAKGSDDNQIHEKDKLQQNFLKSVGSENHSELRVIDFIFDEHAVAKEGKETDSRWLKFCNTPNPNIPTHFDITDKAAWATISASALGCGAFPIAFEPVLLKRFKQEFGDNNNNTNWPSSFIKIQSEIKEHTAKSNKSFNNNCYFAEEGNNSLNYESFNFPYIDGGTFNNEPIREAFKIGTFQDFGRITHNEERLILFVDPIVRKEQYHSFKVSAFSPVKISDNEVSFKKELGKLLGNTSSILGVLTNQGSIKEEHKIIDIKENFELRNTIFNYLDANTNMSGNLNIKIIATAFNKIAKNLKNGIISLGTRDPMEYFLAEIHKSCLQQEKDQTECLNISKAMLNDLKDKINDHKIADITQVYDLLKLNTQEDRNGFAQTVFKVIADFALNTDGKNENAYRAAILPINKNLDTIELPGSEIEAFGGFASLKARQYAFEFARLSTLLSLKESAGGYRPNSPFIANEGFKNFEELLTNKIEKINFFSNKNEYAKELENHLFTPSLMRIKGVLLSNKYLKFILLKIPFVATSLLGTVIMPIASIGLFAASIFRKSPWRGSNIIKKFISNSVNQINYLPLEPVTISILSDTELNTKLLFRCADNSIKKRKAIEDVLEISENKKRYQYYFQVSLLEYIKQENAIRPDTISQNAISLKISSQLIQRLGLSLSGKVKVPNNIDGNLDPINKRVAIENNYTDIITEMRIDDFNLPLLNNAVNDPSTGLHYSLKNINYHVNPLLEIDLQKITEGWYFKEQTESLDKKLLR
ncbi:patatin-like phospholipase family protein [Aquimarina sp. 2201CG14-23]|uniref:patatin-like phospholipase family protein n=1 Tax=Aquimarina mycalae TaxID=3040073 RepID=UPI0024780AF9|nr:patatin-like phospholipase family protein [Aquimarina sp. 2201CG14-23]MDH7445231.1 patatin-like phospholipase family protein [Aquimarina sp. 2201CG14-23]